MKQIEITVEVFDDLENAIKKLELQGFRIIRKGRIEDVYMTQLYNELKPDNILNVLSNSILLRNIDNNGEIYKKITYKKKEYKNDVVMSEEKISVACDDIDEAEKLFESLNFKKIVRVAYDLVVLAKENIELAFQNVENLGLFVEYENEKDYDKATMDEIIVEKENMLKELKAFNLSIGRDYDIKKAYEIIKKSLS
jgi:predicted adenylyl cyclase CyaB